MRVLQGKSKRPAGVQYNKFQRSWMTDVLSYSVNSKELFSIFNLHNWTFKILFLAYLFTYLVTPKMSIQSLWLSTHADGKSGEISSSTKYFCRKTELQHCSAQLNHMGKTTKKREKKLFTPFWTGCASSTGVKLGSRVFWRLGLCRTSCMEPFLLCFFKFPEQVSIYFTCLRECCNSVLLWSSRNVFSTPKLPPAFHQHEGEWIMTECSFLGELFLQDSIKVELKPITFFIYDGFEKVSKCYIPL